MFNSKKLDVGTTLRDLYLKESKLKAEEKTLTAILNTKGINPDKKTYVRFNEVKKELKNVQNSLK